MYINDILIKLIRKYQMSLSPILKENGWKCLYNPTCSDHAVDCLNKYNFLKAGPIILFRILSCNPINAHIKNRKEVTDHH